jgi:hypothetical protein
MKPCERFFVVFLCFYALAVFVCLITPGPENTVNAEELETLISPFFVLDSTTSTGTEPTALAVGERTLLTVEAAIEAASSGDDEISICRDIVATRAITKANVLKLRVLGSGSDSDDIVYELYTGTLGNDNDCSLVHLGTLTCILGTQVSHLTGYNFCDSISYTPTRTGDIYIERSPGSTSNEVAELYIDLEGADTIVALCSTADCDAKLIGKFF